MSRVLECLSRKFLLASLCFAVASCATSVVSADGVVPGTGMHLAKIGDDFEDPAWEYDFRNPKSTHENTGRTNGPMGRAVNGRWHEGNRGHPDIIRRVETPDGGLPGSEGALFLATRNAGMPEKKGVRSGQDDLFMTVRPRLGGYISVSHSPSVVVRVFLPPFDKWQKRSGSSFAFRATLRGSKGRSGSEPYWPGMFLIYEPGNSRSEKAPGAHLVIRAANSGRDFRGPTVTETGWWTLGMSFTPDGQVHYYAHAGVEDLTAEDHLASHYCYGFRGHQLRDVFFDLFTHPGGRGWSTGWVIDDPAVYVATAPRRTARDDREPRRK